MSEAGVVAALNVEARTLGPLVRRADGLFAIGPETLVAISGVGGVAAAAAARALVDAGAGALVSWGMAGGLDPALRAGAVCLPTAVISNDSPGFADRAEFGVDAHWRELVGAAIGDRQAVVGGTLLTSKLAIETVAGKTEAFRATGASAVDMESAAVAQVAAIMGVPFIAVRVIVDSAADALPAAVVSSTHAGHVQIAKLLYGLARSPRDITSLYRLARRYRAATRALAAVARTGTLSPISLGASSKTRIA